jgi:hypothetical protein
MLKQSGGGEGPSSDDCTETLVLYKYNTFTLLIYTPLNLQHTGVVDTGGAP